MEARTKVCRKIIDCFTLEEIDLSIGMVKKCKELGFDYTLFYKLLDGTTNTISQRFCTKEYSKNIFVLIDIDSLKEYNCITNFSIFKHLGIEYNANESKYIYELKSGRQSLASIGDKVFMLKGGKKRRVSNLKNKTNEVNNLMAEANAKKIIKYRLSSRISKAIQANGSMKMHNCIDLIGCSINQLMQHLESKFIKGMSWDNYGKFGWHIDHIVPCKNFNLQDVSEQKKCFHFLNLQPLWGTSKIAEKYGHLNYIGNINKSTKIL